MVTSDSPYYGQVGLLVRVLPIVARERCFALKGGTAINLFVRDMPRLSVDIDLAYLPMHDRASTLEEIDGALHRIAGALENEAFGLRVSVGKRQEGKTYGLMISNGSATIKIEVSPVLRGCVYAGSTRRIVRSAEMEFGFAEVPIVSFEDLYAGKIIAALDRQHPRDLFDVQLLLNSEGINKEMFRALIVYLISHDGNMARVLDPTLKPLEELFVRQFQGMTLRPVILAELEQVRVDLISLVRGNLTTDQREFLLSFTLGEPRWDLLGVDHAPQLPAVQWKLQNLCSLSATKRRDLISALERALGKA